MSGSISSLSPSACEKLFTTRQQLPIAVPTLLPVRLAPHVYVYLPGYLYLLSIPRVLTGHVAHLSRSQLVKVN